MAVGYETTFVTAITIGIALIASHWLGSQAGLHNAEGRDVGGIFGTAVATMAMLMTTAYILAMDTFGPISYTHLRAHETPEHLVCRLLLEKKKKTTNTL